MKKTLILYLILVGILCAQENPLIVRANYFEAKPGHNAKLEKVLKDHTDRFHQSADHAINTWQVIAGDRTGQFLRTTSLQGWADFDGYQDLPGDQSHWNRSVEPHLQGIGGNVYWKFVPELSFNPPQSTPKMFAVWIVQYKAGGWVKHRDALLKIFEARKENNSSHQVATYTKAIGGEGRLYAFLNPLDSWADLNPVEMNLYEMLVASYGEEEASNILGARSQAVEKYESEVILFRADMSTPPPAE